MYIHEHIIRPKCRDDLSLVQLDGVNREVGLRVSRRVSSDISIASRLASCSGTISPIRPFLTTSTIFTTEVKVEDLDNNQLS
jgi:hypothetical protein